ncbi:hypothetical protein BKA81DRAFT_61329 [Phyllosticta paracitricarpa]|uniref:Uncharacterized protein n=1 Tax=Phyllosticta paracitricarpa TaxID=2016321 RepID=A0ABR1NI66_9PEZI
MPLSVRPGRPTMRPCHHLPHAVYVRRRSSSPPVACLYESHPGCLRDSGVCVCVCVCMPMLMLMPMQCASCLACMYALSCLVLSCLVFLVCAVLDKKWEKREGKRRREGRTFQTPSRCAICAIFFFFFFLRRLTWKLEWMRGRREEEMR